MPLDTQNQESGPQPTGIVERLMRDASDRKRFLKAVGGAGAASFGAFVLAACGSSKTATTGTATTATATATTASSTGGGDVGILNYALTLEYLESEFYKHVIAAKLFTGKVGALVTDFGQQEAEHVIAIRQAVKKLGGTPVAKPEGKFPIENANQVAQLAYTVENLGAAAYLGQAPNIQSAEVLASALAIHSVEARHAATFGTLVHKSVTPDGAFGTPDEMSTVLAAVKPFIA